MGQSQSAPSGRNRNRSSSRLPRPGQGLDLGILHGRKPRPGGEKLDLGNWLRCVLSPPLPPPTAEAEAEAEGKVAGSREEEEAGGEEADHLVIMVNGLYGSSADWKFAAEQFVKRLPGKVFVHRSQSNHSKLTYDGVDIMGERLAEELRFEGYMVTYYFIMQVRQVVQRRTNLRKISFVAHSLGGLVTRYAIGKLYEPSTTEAFSLDTEKLSDEQKVPDVDRDDGKPPLLLRMVQDCDDGKFMSALRSFKRRVAYANITYDHIVGWRTSSIRRQHELPKLKLTAHDQKYPHIINVDKGNSEECCSRNSEDRQQEDSTEDSLADSLEGGVEDAAGYKQPADPQMKDLFLPFRCFCTRKDIQCKDVVLDDHDVAKSIVEFAAHAAIEKLVLGASTRGGFVRFKADISSSISKTAPDFCTVYVVTKGGKVSSVRQAIRQAPTVSPLRTMIQGPKPEQVSTQKWTPPPPPAARGDAAGTPNFQENHIMSPFSRTGQHAGSARKAFPDFSLPESSDISFIGGAPGAAMGGRASTERYPPCPPRLSNGSDGLDQHSFEARTPSRWGDSFGNDSTSHSQTSTSSWSSLPGLPTEDMETEMKRLRLELKQTMDMYSTACKEALTAKQKATELQRWKVEEEQRTQESRFTEESAMALIEQEKAKARAAIEAAEAAQRLADFEAQKRISAEMKALKEAEERLRSMGAAREGAAIRFAEVSLRCCELRRKDRPDLATVVLPELNRLRALGEDNMQFCSNLSARGSGMNSSPFYSNSSYSQPRHDASDPMLGRPQYSSNSNQGGMPTRRSNYN
ncbi:hypothetical protein EJB05_20404 [Eragrostis curvula]|uniref:RING-type E3 ubiquitin transferase n=1 Tax=Eragrostis curvula TaxID=38414 RepID=A0A5J9V084_9POAL|nr:hypothetical protein EJB05_20404 [Eragrostis curvula]